MSQPTAALSSADVTIAASAASTAYPADAASSAAGSSSSSSSAAIPSSAPPPGALVINPRDSKEAPLRKLTTQLLATYKLINHRYYEAKKVKAAAAAAVAAAAGAKPVEDYVVSVGELLGGHYRVEESMGKGSFGQVVAAVDVRTNVRVAVKVIKNKEAFRRQARTEVKLLELLNKKDPEDAWCIGAWGWVGGAPWAR